APFFPFREIALSGAAASKGWRIRQGFEVGETALRHGLIAEGPVGLGWVTLLGAEPARWVQPMPDKTAADITRDLWHLILKPVLERTRPVEDDPYQSWRVAADFSGGSGPDRETRCATHVCLDGIARTPPISHFVAWCIGS